MKAWWIALVLAGCTAVEPTPEQAPVVVTAPSDYGYNTTVGMHVHDYWGGEQRLQVLDAAQRVDYLVNGGRGPYLRPFVPQDGQVVPLGTRFVEVTTTYSERRATVAGTPELWVQTANQTQPQRIGPMASGQTLTFEVGLADADLPHQLLSAWRFYFAVPVPDGQPGNPFTGNVKSFDYDVAMVADVVRGLEIPPFPAHPDRWGNATQLPLVEEASGSTLLWTGSPPSCGYCSGGIYEVAPDNGSLVPHDARDVVVEMRHTAQTPTSLRLLYRGADTREFREAPLVGRDDDLYRHEIPVSGAGDGPYSRQSLWRFYFAFDGDGPYSGQWSLSATVRAAQE